MRALISGPGLAIVGAALLVLGPLGTRVGLWPFLVGFALLAISLVLGIAGVIGSLLAGVRSGQWGSAGLGIAIGLIVVAVPLVTVLSARGAPPINDITTDMDDPPRLVALLPLRGAGVSDPDYAGAEFAAQQRRAFPDVAPLTLPMPASSAFDRADAVARDAGWEIVSSDRGAGRIEAIDTTFWFGFKDDIVIRVREEPAGARVDMRSKSRVGRGDLGTNAKRIRQFLAALQAAGESQ